MGDAPAIRLSLADQALINVCGMMACKTAWRRDADERLWLDSLAEVLPHVNRDLPAIEDLAYAARDLIEYWASGEKSTPGEFATVMFRLRQALFDIFRHRAAGALNAWQAEVAG